MMMWSDASCPASITFFAAAPSGVPAFTAARSMSPVEICGMPNFSLMKVACVPLPAPGGPRRMRRMACFSLSVPNFMHRLEILRRVYAGRDLGLADRDRNTVAVPEHAQLLQCLGLLKEALLEGRELCEKPRPISIDAGMPVPGRARLSRIGNLRAREIERVALRVEYDFHDIRAGERRLVVNRVARGGYAGAFLLLQGRRDLRNQPRRNKRLVALHVDHDLPVLQLQDSRRLRDAIGSGSVVGARHQRRVAVAANRLRDPLVVGGDMDRGGSALLRLLADPHHHGLARDVGEGFSWAAAGSVAGGDDDGELHATSSSGGSLRASSSSITGMLSLTG